MVKISDEEYNKLQETRELAESTINTIREPLIVLDSDLKVVSASRAFYQIFKVKPEETENHFIYDLGNKQWDITALRKLLESILPNNESFDNYEVEHDFPGIGKRIMLLNARRIPRPPAKLRMILLAIEDVTERKKIQSDKLLALILRINSIDAIIIQDLEGRITTWNRGAELLYGYSEKEALQMNIEMLTPPNKLAEEKDFTQQLFADKNVVTFESQRLAKDGHLLDVWLTVTRLVDDNGKIIGIASSARDVTVENKLKTALEQKIKDLEAFYDLAVGRENKMIELEKDINSLLKELGRMPKYS